MGPWTSPLLVVMFLLECSITCYFVVSAMDTLATLDPFSSHFILSNWEIFVFWKFFKSALLCKLKKNIRN